jgi:hypothetical protein
MENKEIQLFDKAQAPTFSSIKAESEEEKIKLLNALENCDFLLNDIAPKEIVVKDVFIQQYEKEIEGEKRIKYRTILFDTEGKTYVTTSNYFFFALSKIFSVLGTPDKWNKTYTFEIYKKDVQNGKKALSVKIKA